MSRKYQGEHFAREGTRARARRTSPTTASGRWKAGLTMTTQKSAPVVVADANPFLQANPMNILANPFSHQNPFATRSDEVPADAPEGSYTYKLVQSGPEVPAEECEREVAAVEVVIRWGDSVLHVAHLTPPRSFYVGEEQAKGLKCDFFLPEEKIGSRRMPLLLADARGDVRLVISAG